MDTKNPTGRNPLQIAAEGELLSNEGPELEPGCWESAVYLGRDRFVYHLTATRRRGVVKRIIASKRPVGEYLRWVDGIFQPGDLPDNSKGVHYRAARSLRELL